MCCAIYYHLYNLKNVKNTHGRVLLLVKLMQRKASQSYRLKPIWSFGKIFPVKSQI